MNILQITTCRPALFWRLWESWLASPQLDEWCWCVNAQAWPENDQERLVRELRKHSAEYACLHDAKLGPIWHSRMLAFKFMRPGDILCLGDDDMVFLPETDYATPSRFIRNNPHVGVVTTNFQRFASSPRPPTPQLFSERIRTGVGGGMLLGYESAQCILQAYTPGADYYPDDIHYAAACYVAGKVNYFYHGSLCIHEWGMPGGCIEDQRANPWLHRGNPKYFWADLKKKHIPSKQFQLEYTVEAHATHAANVHRWL